MSQYIFPKEIVSNRWGKVRSRSSANMVWVLLYIHVGCAGGKEKGKNQQEVGAAPSNNAHNGNYDHIIIIIIQKSKHLSVYEKEERGMQPEESERK